MPKKKVPSLKISKIVPNDAVVQPIIEHETSAPETPISEMLEDMHDMVENVSHMSADIVEIMVSSMGLTTNLMSNVFSGATVCVGDMINRNSTTSDKFMKCSNAHDIISFNHNIFDNNFGVFNQFGLNYNNHMNDFTKGLSDIISYNLKNNWIERFKNKKRYS